MAPRKKVAASPDEARAQAERNNPPAPAANPNTPIVNPRAGAAGTGASRGALTGDAARIGDINIRMAELQNTINANKPGSKKYNDALAEYNKLKAEKARLEAKGKAEVSAKADAARNKKIQQAEDDIKRAEDTGNAKAKAAAEARLKALQAEAAAEGGTYNERAAAAAAASGVKGTVSTFTGSGTNDKPLEKDGELFTGTYKGKQYKNGVLVTAGTTTGTTTSTSRTTTTTSATTTAAGEQVDENKLLWVSYLRTTFAALDDKNQKAEIDKLFNQAIKEGWDEKTFMEALKGTSWWQTNYASFRQYFLESNDPRNAGTFAEKVKNQMNSVMKTIEALGISPRSVDPATGKVIDNTEFIKGIALEAIKNNWDTDQLENYLSTKGEFIFTGGGTIGSYMDRIKSNAYLYGINIDENLQKAINTSLLDPLDGRDYNYWINSIKQMAIDAPENKPFRDSLMSGRSLYEVTSTYRNQMANLLEVDSTAISWNDLMSKVVDGNTGNARTFADFTKALKNDPLWQYTRNAKETYSNMALDLAKMFGYSG